MKVKTVEINGTQYAELQDGKPIVVHADGKELPFDAEATVATISRLNAEAKSHRERAEAAESKLKEFDGIEDAEAARKAIELAKNVDEGKLVAAGKVDEIKRAAAKAAEEQVAAAAKANAEKLAEAERKLEQRTKELDTHIIGGGFARSKLITDEKHPNSLVIPPDIAESFFGRNFKVEEGRAVGYDAAGNKIFSRARPGEVADFDEALETLVDAYPNKNSILRGSGAFGMGAGPSANGGVTKKFSEMNEQERTAVYRENPQRYQQLKEQG